MANVGDAETCPGADVAVGPGLLTTDDEKENRSFGPAREPGVRRITKPAGKWAAARRGQRQFEKMV
eukprot:8842131-Lingulodinium_polyedra.AAC.1